MSRVLYSVIYGTRPRPTLALGLDRKKKRLFVLIIYIQIYLGANQGIYILFIVKSLEQMSLSAAGS